MRTSKAVAVLDEREAALRSERQTLATKLAGVEAAIDMVQEMREKMQALPKRSSRAKRTQAVIAASVANDKATAA